MSDAAIDKLSDAERVLRGAMQDADPQAIENALTNFIAAIEAVRGIGAWHITPDLKQRLQDLQARMTSDQRLARLLADMAQLKIDQFSASFQPAGRNTYTRKG